MEQEIKMLKRNNKILMGILIIFILLCIGLGVYFLFKNDNNIDDSSNQNINKNNNDVKVIEILNYSDNKQFGGKELKISYRIPYITSVKNNALLINNKIMQDFILLNNYGGLMANPDIDRYNVDVSYASIIKNNIVVIERKITFEGEIARNYYFYDISNDKILEAKDAVKILEIKDLKTAKSYDELYCATFDITSSDITIREVNYPCD